MGCYAMTKIPIKYFESALIFVISLFAMIVNFFVRAVVYYNIAKTRNIKHRYLSWFPILQFFVIGKIADDICSENEERKSNCFILLAYAMIIGILGFVSTFFTKLPIFTFNVTNSLWFLVNFVLFMINVFFFYQYIHCIFLILKRYSLSCSKLIYAVVFIASIAIIIDLDFIASVLVLAFVNEMNVRKTLILN